MAVELIIENLKTGEKKLVPIATSEVFRTYWEAGGAALKLRVVPLLPDSLFEKADLPGLLDELTLLKEWFGRTQSARDAQTLIERVDGIVSSLRPAVNEPENYEVF